MDDRTDGPSSSGASAAGARVLFISTVESDPWGGSEELWARTAERLLERGVHVAASIKEWKERHPRVRALHALGLEIHQRPATLGLWQFGWRKLLGNPRARTIWLWDLDRCIRQVRPDIVIISEGGNFPAVELMEFLAPRVRFAIVCHNNKEGWWPEDDHAARLRAAIPTAERCYFVSRGNLRLAERQLASEIRNAAIVRNPCNVSHDHPADWSCPPVTGALRLACVGSLDPRAKGQDVLFEALATGEWGQRDWRLDLFGGGPMRQSLGHLAEQLGIAERVTFRGHVSSIERIWAECHVLVQPSRHEGLPLAVVEAMLCGRPVVATDVAGHAEVIVDGETGFLAEAPTARSMGRALERLWQSRDRLPGMGEAAARHIRSIMPRDPAGLFADEIMHLIEAARSAPTAEVHAASA